MNTILPRSGLGGQRELPEEFMRDTAVLLGVFCSFAAEDAAEYASQAGRTVVQRQDMVMALRSLACSGSFWTRDLQARVSEVQREMEEDGSSSSSEEKEEEEGGQDEPQEAWTRAEGSELATLMNDDADAFSSWAPQNPMEHCIKNALARLEGG